MSDVVPDEIEPIIAWRQWDVHFERGVGQNATLRSLNQLKSIWWPGQRAEAICGAGCDHVAPDLECRCGFYAKRKLSDLIGEYEPTGTRPPDFRFVGRCALWGQIVEHADGVRAQYGYPDRLWMVIPEQHLADKDAAAILFREMMPTCDLVQEMYGVPCTPVFVRELAEIADDEDGDIFKWSWEQRIQRSMMSFSSYSFHWGGSSSPPSSYSIMPGQTVKASLTTSSELQAATEKLQAWMADYREPDAAMNRVRRFMWVATAANILFAALNLTRVLGHL